MTEEEITLTQKRANAEIDDLEKEFSEIVDGENAMSSYDPKRIDRSLARMRSIAFRIAYLKATPERQNQIDRLPAELDEWP